MQLLTADSYYKALLTQLPKAKKRIIIHAMVVLWGGRTAKLAPLLEDALIRGVKVRIVGDIYSKYEAKTARIAKRGPRLNWRANLATNNLLAARGADISYIGTLKLNPFKGRCHSKITVIDDTVYTFGGVNFSNPHFGYQDIMFRIKDQELADRMERLIAHIAKDAPFANIEEKIDNHTTLLFDGGNPGQSIIYNTATNLIAEASKVYYVSKMCPTGKLAKLLNTTDSECYFNRPSQEGIPENMAIIFDQIRYGIRNAYTGTAHIHAKCILTEGEDGKQHLITGSNNFSWRGVAFGTKEIAMHSTDPRLWDAVYDFIQDTVAAKD